MSTVIVRFLLSAGGSGGPYGGRTAAVRSPYDFLQPPYDIFVNIYSLFHPVKTPKGPLLYVEKEYQKIFQEYLIFDFTQNYF